MMQTASHFTPLRHWSDVQLRAIALTVSDACQRWRRDWAAHAQDGGPDEADGIGAAAALVAEDSSSCATGTALHAGGSTGADLPCAWLARAAVADAARAPSLPQAVASLLFGETVAADHSLAAEVCAAAVQSLLDRLRTALGMGGGIATDAAFDDAHLPAAAFQLWSGAVRIALPRFGGMALILNGACVETALAPGPAKQPPTLPVVTSVLKALKDQPLQLYARLNSVDLTLGHLRSLAIGDIVILPHALAEALTLQTTDGSAVCRGYLGKKAGGRALEVIHLRPGAAPQA